MNANRKLGFDPIELVQKMKAAGLVTLAKPKPRVTGEAGIYKSHTLYMQAWRKAKKGEFKNL